MDRGVRDYYIHQITEGIISNIVVTEEKTEISRIQKKEIYDIPKTRGRRPDNKSSFVLTTI
jgi:hypothetical protein